MKYVLIVAGVVVGLIVLAFVGLLINLRLASRRQGRRMRERLAPVIDPIRAGSPPDATAIASLAADAEARNALYDALDELGHAAVFPDRYRTLAAFAESVLVSWLAHPNELQKAPDEIELVGEYPIDSGTDLGEVSYFLYRFRVQPPHFAASKGWMAGVSGPYIAGARPRLITPIACFSELAPFGECTPEEHVMLVHNSAVSNGTFAAIRTQFAAAPRAVGARA